MIIHNIGYNHRHDADFFISRPNGSGDNLLLLLKTPATFTINGAEYESLKDSFLLYRKGTPQYYRAAGEEFVNDWFHFTFSKEEEDFLQELQIPFDQIVPIGDMTQLSMFVRNMSYKKFQSFE